MMKFKVLGHEVEFNDEGSFSTDNEELFQKLVEVHGTEILTGVGEIEADTTSVVGILVMCMSVDEDFEYLGDDENIEIQKRIIQEGDVLTDSE